MKDGMLLLALLAVAVSGRTITLEPGVGSCSGGQSKSKDGRTAWEFDGTQGREVNCEVQAVKEILASNTFTIELEFFVSAWTTDGSTSRFYIYDNGNQWRVDARETVSYYQFSSGANGHGCGKSGVSLNRWFSQTLSCSNGSCDFYLDGQRTCDSITLDGSLISASNTLYIGSGRSRGNLFSTGYVRSISFSDTAINPTDTASPSSAPSKAPTGQRTRFPTESPTMKPSLLGATLTPSLAPSFTPTESPSEQTPVPSGGLNEGTKEEQRDGGNVLGPVLGGSLGGIALLVLLFFLCCKPRATSQEEVWAEEKSRGLVGFSSVRPMDSIRSAFTVGSHSSRLPEFRFTFRPMSRRPESSESIDV